jgi:spermidine synthase
MLKKHDLYLLPFLYGLVTLGFQILFVRRLISIFGSSEINYTIAITIWLLMTGLGAYLAEKLRISSSFTYVALGLYVLIAVIFYGALPKMYDIWGLQPGEATGYVTMGATALLSLFILCLFSGGLFVGIVQTISHYGRITSLSFAYVIESLGSLAGGVLITFVCLTFIPDRYIALGLFVLIVILMFVKIDKRLLLMPPRVTVGIMCLFAGVAFALGNFGHQYGEQTEVARTDTPYQHLTLTEYESQYTLYSDGMKQFSYPLVNEAEELNLVLWQKQEVTKVGMLGLCSPDRLAEVLKYPDAKIDLYETDKMLYQFLLRFMPPEAGAIYQNSRINYIWGDPYFKINEEKMEYDFLIINYDNPTDGVSNRYFTVDFYKNISQRLPLDCIVSFSIPASGNILGRDLQDYLSIIYNSLHIGFNYIRIIPGDNYIFLATNDPAAIDLSISHMLASKRYNHIKTDFVDSVYLSYSLDQFNMQKAEDIYLNRVEMANTISRPIVFYFNSILWADRFSRFEEQVLKYWRNNISVVYILLFLPILALLNLVVRSMHKPAYLSICFLSGFSGIAMEMSLLILYQSHLGNVYSQLGILVGLFMVGMALGGALPLKSKGTTIFRRSWFYLGAMLGSLVFLGLLAAVRFEGHALLMYFLIITLAFLAGAFSGFLFNFAAVSYRHKYEKEAPGKFYLADLLGASLAGIFTSVVFIPLIGFGSILALFIIILLVYVILHRFVIIET